MNNLLTDSFELPRRDSSRDADIEMGMHQADASDNLKDFSKKVDAIESLIAKLTNLLNKLQTANEESKAVTKASSMKAIKQRMEKDIDEVGKIARQAKTKVDELEKDNLSNRQKPGCGKGSAVDRSREQTTGAVKKKLKERMDDFQTLREAIRQEYREVDEETIDYLIETGKSEQIFKDAIQHQGRGQERHDAVRDLERKLLELQQIFMDMAVLVEAQGDMINIIETHDSFELPWRDSSRDADIEMGMHQADASDNLKDFLKKVDAIESLIAKLTNLLNKLQTANEEPKAVTKASSMKAIKQRMEKDIDEVGKIARQAKTKVDELEKDNLSNRQKPGCGKGSAVDRSREQTTGAVKKKLKERMDDFQIFMDMLVLVEAQGDMINNIETHVSNATNHIQHGVTALQNAKKLPKNSRKWMSCCW